MGDWTVNACLACGALADGGWCDLCESATHEVRVVPESCLSAPSPQVEDHEKRVPCPACIGSASGLCSWHRDYARTSLSPSQRAAARSPQGEDHEAGIAWTTFWQFATLPHIERMKRVIAAVDRARVSPSRDGTVAVEDVLTTGACLEAARQAIESMRTTGERIPSSGAMALAALTAALAEFSRPSADDQPSEKEKR